MEAEIPHRGVRILCLDGGGVKGLSELMILDYLMRSINQENPPKPCEVFDIIGGTSTGGLIAIMLGRLQMSVEEAIQEYLEISRKVFAPKHKVNLIKTFANIVKAKGRCDSEVLKQTTKLIVAKKLGNGQEEALLLEGQPKCRVFVCSIRADLRSLICFRNYSSQREMDLKPTIWEAALATSAATTFFDPVTIGKYGQKFVDGGGGYNNPVQEALDAAFACFPGSDIQFLVSIGTGEAQAKGFGNSLKQVVETLKDIATDTDNNFALFARTHPDLKTEGPERRLFRFQVDRGMENVGLAEHEKKSVIAAATQEYMQGSDKRGAYQLQAFKTIYEGTRTAGMETPFKISTVPLEMEKVRYIEQFATTLQAKSPKLLLPLRKPDYSSAIILLPRCIFLSPKYHSLEVKAPKNVDEPTWKRLLDQYQGRYQTSTLHTSESSRGYSENLSPNRLLKDEREPDNIWKRVSANTPVWVPDYGGEFAPEIPVSEVWRLITSFPLQGIFPNYPCQGNMWVGDLSIDVPRLINGKPLVHIEFNSKNKWDGYGRRNIEDEEMALAMCGGRGLPLDRTVRGKLKYSSEAKGWDHIPFPEAFAFCTIPRGQHCYFAEQIGWATRKLRSMLEVCDYLWDHADAADCNMEGVPIKILLRRATDEISQRDWTSSSIKPLSLALERHLDASLDFTDTEDYVEIEDAVTLLRESGKYTSNDITAWDEDGMNNVIDRWWGRFTAERARWIALDMTLKLFRNLSPAVQLPNSFTPLLHSSSGNCFLV